MLVYVPHTTAAVTINEKIDPVLVADLERAFEKVVGDDWGWGHDDVDGPNGPSHGRASVAGAQVLIPLRDGAPALGRYQAVFLCEFDGPKARSVYVRSRDRSSAGPVAALRRRVPRARLGCMAAPVNATRSSSSGSTRSPSAATASRGSTASSSSSAPGCRATPCARA